MHIVFVRAYLDGKKIIPFCLFKPNFFSVKQQNNSRERKKSGLNKTYVVSDQQLIDFDLNAFNFRWRAMFDVRYEYMYKMKRPECDFVLTTINTHMHTHTQRGAHTYTI